MNSHELNAKNYYDNYESQGFSLTLYDMWTCLVWMMTIPEEPLNHLRQKAHARLLVLGSATPSNATYVSNINGFLRPEKEQDDTVTIIDQNLYPLTKHAEYINTIDDQTHALVSHESAYPRFELIQGDMRQLPFTRSSFDVVISDYTFNFLSTREEVEQTFQSISHVLNEGGLCILAVRGKGHSDMSLSDAVVLDFGRFKISAFPLETYTKIARENNLQLISSF